MKMYVLTAKHRNMSIKADVYELNDSVKTFWSDAFACLVKSLDDMFTMDSTAWTDKSEVQLSFEDANDDMVVVSGDASLLCFWMGGGMARDEAMLQEVKKQGLNIAERDIVQDLNAVEQVFFPSSGQDTRLPN